MCGRKNGKVHVKIIPDHKSEKVTKTGARLTKVSPNNAVNVWWKK